MITSALLYLFGIIISALAAILPEWTYPTTFIDGIKFFMVGADSLNFIFPIYTFIQVALFSIAFEVSYYSARIVGKLILADRIDI
jgi:sterol desaturase/sphingolipid hydroxylase (fatty acid hydroxylase superfamily)